MSGTISFLESYRGMHLLAGAMEVGRRVKMWGKVAGKPDNYIINIHGVLQVGSLDDPTIDVEKVAWQIRGIDKIIGDF